MKSIHYFIKAGVKDAPALLIIFYYFLVSTDLLTTYLVTPDLAYEGNWLVKLFDLKWFGIITLAISGALSLSFFYLLSLFYTKNYFQKRQTALTYNLFKEIIKNKGLIISFIIIGYFYKHFFYSIFVIFNNLIGYIYINNLENCILNRFSQIYFKFESYHYPYFFPLTHIAILVIAYFYTFLKFKEYKLNSQLS